MYYWIKAQIEKERAAGIVFDYSASEVVLQTTDSLDALATLEDDTLATATPRSSVLKAQDSADAHTTPADADEENGAGGNINNPTPTIAESTD